MRLYTVVTVYSVKYLPRYHVVNMETKKIQSSWDSWPKAVETSKDLNLQNTNTINKLGDKNGQV